MSYSNPVIVALSYGEHDFGAASERVAFSLPNGLVGRLKEIIVSATETFTNTTTEGFVKVGSAAGGAQYANMGLGTLADGADARLTDVAADLVSADLPADTDIHVEFTAPTGGTPAGKAFVQIIVECF